MRRTLLVGGLLLVATLAVAGAASAHANDLDPSDGDVHVHEKIGTPDDRHDGWPGVEIVVTCSTSNATTDPANTCFQDETVDERYCPSPNHCVI